MYTYLLFFLCAKPDKAPERPGKFNDIPGRAVKQSRS